MLSAEIITSNSCNNSQRESKWLLFTVLRLRTKSFSYCLTWSYTATGQLRDEGNVFHNLAGVFFQLIVCFLPFHVGPMQVLTQSAQCCSSYGQCSGSQRLNNGSWQLCSREKMFLTFSLYANFLVPV